MKAIKVHFLNTGTSVPDAESVRWAISMIDSVEEGDNDATIFPTTEAMFYAIRALQIQNRDFEVEELIWPNGEHGIWNNENAQISNWPETPYEKLLNLVCFPEMVGRIPEEML